MCTTSCRNKHIQAIQCLHGQLGGTLATALATGRGDVRCLVKRTNIVRAYLRILYCHWTPTTAMNYLFSITMDAADGTNQPATSITQTTTDGVQTYSNVKPLWTSHAYGLEEIAGILDDDTTIEWELDGTTLFIWSSSNQLEYSSVANLTVTDLSSSIGDHLLGKNCLTNSEIENIIQSAYKVLESESGCGCS